LFVIANLSSHSCSAFLLDCVTAVLSDWPFGEYILVFTRGFI